MQLVIHSPFGSRINRAWGLALRKRFCRKFNFELQAAATEDNIVLSLTTAHSFELDEVARYLNSDERARGADPGHARRADVHHALALGGGRLARAAPLPRRQEGAAAARCACRRRTCSAAVFPDQIACAENLAGEREVPDHPLVQSDDRRLPQRGDGHRGPGAAAGAHRVRRHPRRRLRSDRAVAAGARGAVRAALRVPRRRAAGGAPHAGRHGAALAATRKPPPTSAGSTRRRSRGCAPRPGPMLANADELHDALVWLAFLTETEAARARRRGAAGSRRWRGDRRVTLFSTPQADVMGRRRAACAIPGRSGPSAGSSRRSRRPPTKPKRRRSKDDALVEILRGRLEGLGPVTPRRSPRRSGLSPARLQRRSPRSKAKASSCAGASSPASTTSNGATGACWRASIATRSSGCAPRSSRSRRATSCASCSPGSTSPRKRAWKGRTRSPLSSTRSKASRRRRRLGDRDPARAPRRLSALLGSTPMPRRPHVLGASDASAAQRRRARASIAGRARRRSPSSSAAAPPFGWRSRLGAARRD